MSIFLQNWVALGQGARDVAVPVILSVVLSAGICGVGYPSHAFIFSLVDHRRRSSLMVALTLYIKNSRLGRVACLVHKICKWPIY